MANGAWLSPRVFLVLLVLMLAATVAQLPAAHGQSQRAAIRFDGVSYSTRLGGTIPVKVKMEDLNHHGIVTTEDVTPPQTSPSDGLAGFELAITFDPAVVAVERVVMHPDIERTGRDFACFQRQDEPDLFQFGCASQGEEREGPQGTLYLAELTLRAVGPGSRTLQLEAQAAGPLGDDIPLDEVPAIEVRVQGQPNGGPNVQPTSTLRPGETPGQSQGPSSGTPTPPTVGSGNTPSPPEATATAIASKEAANATATARRVIEEGSTPLPPGGEDGGEGGDSASAGDIAMWSLVVAGGIIATGGLTMAAVWWRRRNGTWWQPGA